MLSVIVDQAAEARIEDQNYQAGEKVSKFDVEAAKPMQHWKKKFLPPSLTMALKKFNANS